MVSRKSPQFREGRQKFNEFLRYRREVLGLTQKDLDQALGLAEGTIQRVEAKYEGDPGIDLIARLLKRTPEVLVFPDGRKLSFQDIVDVLDGVLDPFIPQNNHQAD